MRLQKAKALASLLKRVLRDIRGVRLLEAGLGDIKTHGTV